MCIMVYIAANTELPLVSRFNETNYIYVEPIPHTEPPIIPALTKSHVYYVGSYQGCGCGFAYDDTPSDSRGIMRLFRRRSELVKSVNEEDMKRRRSVQELVTYLADNINRAGVIELYSCWAGDESSNPEQVSAITIAELTPGSKFSFEEKHLLIIRP